MSVRPFDTFLLTLTKEQNVSIRLADGLSQLPSYDIVSSSFSFFFFRDNRDESREELLFPRLLVFYLPPFSFSFSLLICPYPSFQLRSVPRGRAFPVDRSFEVSK